MDWRRPGRPDDRHRTPGFGRRGPQGPPASAARPPDDGSLRYHAWSTTAGDDPPGGDAGSSQGGDPDVIVMTLHARIKEKYGPTVVTLVRKLEQTDRKLGRFKCHLEFTVKCKEHEVAPGSLKVSRSVPDFGLVEERRMERRIKECHDSLEKIQEEKAKLEQEIAKFLSEDLLTEAKAFCLKAFEQEWAKAKKRQDMKFKVLQDGKKMEEKGEIENAIYYRIHFLNNKIDPEKAKPKPFYRLPKDYMQGNWHGKGNDGVNNAHLGEKRRARGRGRRAESNERDYYSTGRQPQFDSHHGDEAPPWLEDQDEVAPWSHDDPGCGQAADGQAPVDSKSYYKVNQGPGGQAPPDSYQGGSQSDSPMTSDRYYGNVQSSSRDDRHNNNMAARGGNASYNADRDYRNFRDMDLRNDDYRGRGDRDYRDNDRGYSDDNRRNDWGYNDRGYSNSNRGYPNDQRYDNDNSYGRHDSNYRDPARNRGYSEPPTKKKKNLFW